MFDLMLANYQYCREHYVDAHKSAHWDVFSADFESQIENEQAWPAFRRNGISNYLDTTILDSTNEPSRTITDSATISNITRRWESLRQITGAPFIREFVETETGEPRYAVVDDVRLNTVELRHIFNLWRINTLWPELTASSKPAVIAEIGAGYGGLALKLKRLLPEARIILFDLPEANVIQTYYLKNAMPDAVILGATDFSDLGPSELASKDWDFLILPGWNITELPDDFVTLCINARSMMEMKSEIVRFYVREIERIVGVGGGFYCINRYVKSTVGEEIRIKDYPFDSAWNFIVSEPAWDQPWIHELFMLRGRCAGAISPQQALAHLPPYRWRDLIASLRMSARVFWALTWGANRNVNPGIRGIVVNLAIQLERSVVAAVKTSPALHRFVRKIRRGAAPERQDGTRGRS